VARRPLLNGPRIFHGGVSRKPVYIHLKSGREGGSLHNRESHRSSEPSGPPLRMDRIAVRSHARFIWNQSPTGSNGSNFEYRAHSGISGSRMLLSALLSTSGCDSTPRRKRISPKSELSLSLSLSLSRLAELAGRSGDSADSAPLAGQRNCRSNTTRRAQRDHRARTIGR